MKNKEQKIITILSVLYVVAVYASIALFISVLGYLGDRADIRVLALLFLPLVLTVINIIYLKRNYNAISREILLKCALFIKYLLIPIYIMGGVLNIILFLLIFTPVVIMVFVSPVVISILCVFGWLYMIGGSVFSMLYISRAEEEGVHDKVWSMIAKVFQIFFVLDVIAMMALSIKEKKYIPATLTVILIMSFGAIGTIIWILFGIFSMY